MATKAAKRLRDRMPAPIRKLATIAFRYAYRLDAWRMVLRDTKAEDAKSRQALRKSVRAAPITAFGDFHKWKAPQLLAAARFEVRGCGRFECRPRTDDLYHILPRAQAAVYEAIRAHLKPGMTFVDAGANIGLFTILGARLVGETGKVLAIEMAPETATILRRHVEINDLTNVTVIERALSDHDGGEVVAHIPHGHTGQASIFPNLGQQGSDVAKVRVPTITLDTLTRELKQIDLLKIDLEGAEAVALEGAKQMLGCTRLIVFEAWPGDPEAEKSVERIRSAGFVVKSLDNCNMIATRTSCGNDCTV